MSYLWISSQKLLLSFIFLNMALSAVTGYLTPKIIAQFYQSLGDDQSFNQGLFYLLVILIAEYLNRCLFTLSTHHYIRLLLVSIRRECYSKWMKASFRTQKGEDYPLGEVLARLMSDPDAVREIVSSGSFAIFIDVIFIGSCLISFLQLNSTSGVMLFFAEVICCILLIMGSKAMGKVFMNVRRLTGKMSRDITDLTSGMTQLSFLPVNKYASKRGEKVFDEFLNEQLKANIWDAGYYSAAESLYPILIALIMIIVPFSQLVEVAVLAALIDLIQKSITPIKDIASKISVLSRAQTGVKRIDQFLESFSGVHRPSLSFQHLKINTLNVTVQKFTYEEGFELNDIKFNLKKGEVLGIIGESGCGKSTLLKLLSGQYQKFQGLLEVDELKINPDSEDGLHFLSTYVSLISQDSHVFSDSLKFNITLGDDGDFEKFWELAKDKIPYLQRWGVSSADKINIQSISLGQKQLISGLRALYLKKPIIMMDEISSGLDSELEGALRDLVNFFQHESITIIVTHRLETILNATELVLLHHGQLIAKGRHQKLQSDENYKKFLAHLNT